MLQVGIAAQGLRAGRSGGLDVYARQLIEALAEYVPKHTFVVLIRAGETDAWQSRSWPKHVQFARLSDIEPRRSLTVRVLRRLQRALGLPVPPQSGEPYLARQIDALGLDLIHYPQTRIHPLSVRTPCVLGFADMQHEYYPEFYTKSELEFRARTYRPAVDKAVHIIAPSHYTQRTLVEKYSVPLSKLTVVPLGIPERFRRASPDEIRRVHIKYDLPDEYVYYPANPWQHKNHARLVAAMRIHRERYGDCPWLVLSGRLIDERRDAMSLAIAAGLEDRVLDLAFVDACDLPALYSAARLLVFPSLFEGFGLPLVEAMACGCPIAAADATTIPEITNGAALLFDPFDPDQMAQAIHRMLHDSILREDLVARGYARLPRFAWEAVVPQLIAVYERVARENRPVQRREH